MSDDTIEWRFVPNTDFKYQVSNTGLVRGVKSRKILSPGDYAGYAFVHIFINQKWKVIRVHRLVMLAFVGECPSGMEVNHKNSLRHDNRLENLEYLTHLDNMRQIKRIYKPKPQKKKRLKLDECLVRKIRDLSQLGLEGKELASRFGVSTSTISRVINRIVWKHID